MKINEYVGKIAVVYFGTPTLDFGAVVRVLDLDATSKGEVSLLVLPLQKEKDYSSVEFNVQNFEQATWIKLSDVKNFVDFNRPNGVLWLKVKSFFTSVLIKFCK